MRVPDRPWTETDVDGSDGRRAGADYRPPRPERLAERLARLGEGHPSAWPDRSSQNLDELDAHDTGRDDDDPAEDRSPDDVVRDDEFPVDADPEDADPADVSAEDLENPEVGAGRGADKGPRTHRSYGSATWEMVDTDPHPYRPWFSADGASDPWFAEPADG